MLTKILVVDDEPHFERLILQRFRKNIRAKEYEFFFAENGKDALEKLEQIEGINLILSDINMPIMDGLQFITRLREQNAPQKTIIISAYGDMQNIRAAMNQGAYDFVTKPIDFQDLGITIKKAISDIQALKAAEEAKAKLSSIQKELSAASQIQQSILPHNFESVNKRSSFSLFAKMIPAKAVGGDFYDFFFIDDQHLGVIIGDVSGKGMPAALFMAVSRTLLRASGTQSTDAGKCLGIVNNLLCQNNEASMFVTVFYGIIDFQNNTLSFVSAGHNPPYMLHQGQQLECLDDNQFPALGMIEDIQFTAKTIPFGKQSNLLLFTDGLTEALNSEQEFFTEERLETYLTNTSIDQTEMLVNDVIREVKHFVQAQPPSDDLTVLSIKREQ
jgi:sigma-B regulation protein RsbU (phosphoserine phosphatase)